MNPMDSDLKNRFVDESVPVDAVGSEALWNAVSGALEAKRRRSKWLWLGSALLVASGAVGGWITLRDANLGNKVQDVAAWDVRTTWKGEAAWNSRANTPAVERVPDSVKTPAEHGVLEEVLPVPIGTSDVGEMEANNWSSAATNAGGFVQAAEANRRTEPRSASAAPATTGEAVFLNPSPTAEQNRTRHSAIEPLALRTSPRLKTASTPVLPNKRPWQMPKTRDRLYAKVLVGLNHSAMAFSEGADSQNTHQSADWGQTFGLMLERELTPHWNIGTGLEYSRYWTKFDYEATYAGQQRLENVLLSYVTNTSGDTLETTYGDTLVDATIYRRVLHHNLYATLSVPVEVSWNTSHKRWTVGAGFSAVVHIRLDAQGRNLGAEREIIDLPHPDYDPYPTVGLAGRVRPFVGYSVGARCRLEFAPAFTFQRMRSVPSANLSSWTGSVSLRWGL